MDVVLGKGAPPRPPARRRTRASGPLWPGAPSEWQHSRLLLIVIIAPAFIFLDMDVVLGKGAPPRPPARRQTRASGPLWPGAPKTPM